MQVNASGFFTLFWILVFVALVRTGAQHYSESGVVWGKTFATLISRDAQMLALSDGIMVLSTFLCVPFIKVRPLVLEFGSKRPTDFLISS